MARTAPEARARRAVEACTPASPIGGYILDRYHRALDLRGKDRTVEGRLAGLYELCRLVETVPLPRLSVRALEDLAATPTPTRTVKTRRRQVVRRVIRLLRYDGDLPTARELCASRRVQEQITLAPASGQGTLRRWLAHRQRTVGWHELSWEAVKLRKLEDLIAEHGDLDDGDLIGLWMRTLVRRIANCGHAPLTRTRDPGRCFSCGATIETHGDRPSPSEDKQRELRAVAANYLRFRRRPIPTYPFEGD